MKSTLIVCSSWVGVLSPIYVLIAVCLVVGSNFTYAQTREIDSLRTKLSTVNSDAERVRLMSQLSIKLNDIDFKQALTYTQDALKLSRKINDKENEAKILFNLGKLIYETQKTDLALTHFQESERIADDLGLRELQANNLMSIAKWYRYISIDSAKAVQYLLKSVEVSKAANYDYGTGRSYAKLASFYTRYNQIDLSEEYLELSAEYYMRIENGGEEVAHYYNEVGNKIWDYNPKRSMDLYLKGIKYSENYPDIKVNLAKAHSMIGEPEIALKYLEEAIPYMPNTGSIRMLGIAKAQLAEVYVQLGNYAAADKTCDEGIELLSLLSRSNQRGLPAIYRIKGMVAEHEKNDKTALEYYTKSKTEANRIRIVFESAKADLTLGNFHLLRTPQKSKLFCEDALKKAKKKNYVNLEIEACECLYKIYKNEKAYPQALNYYEQKKILNDSLSSLKIEHALDVNSKIAQKDKQLAEEAYQKEIKEEQLKNQYRLNTTLFISSLIGLSLIGFLMLSIKRISKQNIEINNKTNELENANQNLGRSNEELERFAHIASHDLKSPLKNIINFTGLLRRNLDKSTKPLVKESLDFIENNGKMMNQLIDDILEYSKLSDEGTNEGKQEIINLNDLINEISQLIINDTENTPVNIETSDLPDLKWNYSKMFLLFKNLIENGLKYNESEHPKVKLYFTNNSIYIEDNGIGIKKEYFDKIFVLFQRLHNQSEYNGTGLGLATCKKIVDEFKGKISVSSELNKGTIFKIELPIDLIHHNENTTQLIDCITNN